MTKAGSPAKPVEDWTLAELLASDTYGEHFLIAFQRLLEKFDDEYDDMASMDIIRTAHALREAFNDQ